VVWLVNPRELIDESGQVSTVITFGVEADVADATDLPNDDKHRRVDTAASKEEVCGFKDLTSRRGINAQIRKETIERGYCR
jgi:hypothetical protein